MNLVFMGTPEFAVPVLGKLLGTNQDVRAVFTQPDRPVGRHQDLRPPPVKVYAEAHAIPVLQPEKIRSPEARAQIEPLLKEADAVVVAAYGRILPAWMLAAPRLGCLNVHSSLLPAYRGAAPVNWAIARGERETGVTIMQMDEGLDTGAMLMWERTPIGERERAPEVLARLAEIGAELMIRTLDGLLRGEIKPIPQDDSKASYAPLLRREDGLIDWRMTASEIYNRLRGFTPFPGSYTFFDGRRLEILEAEDELPDEVAASAEPGTVCEVKKDSFVIICGGATRLRVFEVQPAGRRAMAARDFLNGALLRPGAALQSTA
jgi:methionyl-tRNA formyltransferase